RPQREAEDVELTVDQIEQNDLLAVDAEPGQQVIEPQQHPHGDDPQAGKAALDLARVDLGLLDVERNGFLACAVAHLCILLLKRLAGRSSSQVNRLEPAVAPQNRKKPMV